MLPTPPDRALLARLGFRAAGPQMIRVDMAERIAARAHEARAGGASASAVDPALVTSLGLAARDGREADARHRLPPERGGAGWVWRGRERRRRPRAPDKAGSNHFAALAGLKRG